ncbi:MAG: GNAT family N-acetyltransferase [Lachnospiraceae bacterium]|nr:GNAT family N-acetyltransferase [Lachnospiraceae bacterium]
MITIEKNCIDVQDYLAIRNSVGWIALKEEQAQKALIHSLYVIGAYENGQLVGMGRLVGDGAVICYVQDLIVSPEYQQKGVGAMILSHLVDYVKELRIDNTQMMLCLMCAKGREQFYEKHGFVARPTDSLGPGMIQYFC